MSSTPNLKYIPTESKKTLYVVAQDITEEGNCTFYLFNQPQLMIEIEHDANIGIGRIFSNAFSKLAQTIQNFQHAGYEVSYEVPPKLGKSNLRNETLFRQLSLEEMLKLRKELKLPELKLAA